ncbi:MAG: WYL domain-containing protein [Actinobacteria bacterium]|nr:WYL domain-containing protein [Actinomycetota bacterium]
MIRTRQHGQHSEDAGSPASMHHFDSPSGANPDVSTDYTSISHMERLLDLVLLLSNSRLPLTMEYITTQVPGYPPGRDARRQAFDRDRKILAEEGIIIKTVSLYEDRSQLGYSIENDYLDRLELTADEHLVLNMVLAVSRFQAGSYVSPSLAHLFVSMPAGDLLESIYRSIVHNHQITFQYRGIGRKVIPRMLRFVVGRWYLLSWDIDPVAWRTYRLDRIDGDVVEVPGSPSNHDIPLRGSQGGAGSDAGSDSGQNAGQDSQGHSGWADSIWMLGDDQSIKVDVLVDYPLASEVETDLGSSKVQSRDSQGVVFTLDVMDMEALYSWVLSLGDHAEILAPLEVREGMVARIESIIQDSPSPDTLGRKG